MCLIKWNYNKFPVSTSSRQGTSWLQSHTETSCVTPTSRVTPEDFLSSRSAINEKKKKLYLFTQDEIDACVPSQGNAHV